MAMTRAAAKVQEEVKAGMRDLAKQKYLRDLYQKGIFADMM